MTVCKELQIKSELTKKGFNQYSPTGESKLRSSVLTFSGSTVPTAGEILIGTPCGTTNSNDACPTGAASPVRGKRKNSWERQKQVEIICAINRPEIYKKRKKTIFTCYLTENIRNS